MSTFVFDLRCAVRALRKNAFGGVAILTLALGIGSNTALFSIANPVLLRPLPYADPGSLIALSETNPAQGAEGVPASAPSFVAWKTQSRTIERLAAYRPWGFVLSGSGEPERLIGARASADLFPLLGISPITGRLFSAEEDTFGRHHVAVVSQGLWLRRFGADPNLVGRSLVLNGEPYTVVGVLPRDVTLIEADVWVPLALEPFALQQRGTRALSVIGRLRPGATLPQVRAEMQAIAGDVARRFPDGSAGWDVAVVSLVDQIVGHVRPTLLLVWSAVALVLLIACANAANLLLARAASRQHEVAVCLALGASQARVVRRLLTESVLVALLGGLAGLPIAMLGLRLIVALAPNGLPRLDGVGIDTPVLTFTVLASVLSGILVGLVPALRSVRSQVSSALKETAPSSVGGSAGSTLRNAALTCQVALAVVVLVAAGLLVRSFNSIRAIDLGFQPDRVLTMTVSLADAKYGDVQRRAVFFDQLLHHVQRIPGVASAGLVSHLPLAGRRLSLDLVAAGRSPAQTLWADASSVSADYFRAMGIPLRDGRVFDEHDGAGSAPVVVINDEMARRLYPDVNPVGQRLIIGTASGADRRSREIVGVVATVHAAGLEVPPGFQLYVPTRQNAWPTMSLAVRTSGDATASAGAIRAELLALDPDLPAYNVRPLEQVVSRAIAMRRFQMLILGLFAMVGLALAATGVYSVVAYTVRLRTPEIGLRLALGASRRDVLVLVIRSAGAWAGAGIALGAAFALAAGRLLRGMLFGIAPTDPLTFSVVVVVAAVVVLLGSSVAGRQATRVDPLIALRTP